MIQLILLYNLQNRTGFFVLRTYDGIFFRLRLLIFGILSYYYNSTFKSINQYKHIKKSPHHAETFLDFRLLRIIMSVMVRTAESRASAIKI